jgi:hypothetical protein
MIEIHGYAIVSDDDRIADADGIMPASLRNEADWAYFQAELALADWIAVGRLAHAATPNSRGRRRLVLSREARGLERRADAWWWNPSQLPWGEVAAGILPQGGRVGVPGGRAAFDCFLDIGYCAFHLSRVEGLLLPQGRPLFGRTERGFPAQRILAEAGLALSESSVLDAAAGVTLTVWRR